MTSSNKTRPIFMAMIIILTLTGLQAARADEQQSTDTRAGVPSEKASDNASATESECLAALEILDKMIKGGDTDKAVLEMQDEASRQLKQLQQTSSRFSPLRKASR